MSNKCGNCQFHENQLLELKNFLCPYFEEANETVNKELSTKTNEERLMDKLDKLIQEFAIVESDRNRFNDKLIKANKSITDLETEKLVLSKEIVLLKNNKIKQTSEIARLKKRLSKQEETIERLSNELTDLRKNLVNETGKTFDNVNNINQKRILKESGEENVSIKRRKIDEDNSTREMEIKVEEIIDNSHPDRVDLSVKIAAPMCDISANSGDRDEALPEVVMNVSKVEPTLVIGQRSTDPMLIDLTSLSDDDNDDNSTNVSVELCIDINNDNQETPVKENQLICSDEIASNLLIVDNHEEIKYKVESTRENNERNKSMVNSSTEKVSPNSQSMLSSLSIAREGRNKSIVNNCENMKDRSEHNQLIINTKKDVSNDKEREKENKDASILNSDINIERKEKKKKESPEKNYKNGVNSEIKSLMSDEKESTKTRCNKNKKPKVISEKNIFPKGKSKENTTENIRIESPKYIKENNKSSDERNESILNGERQCEDKQNHQLIVNYSGKVSDISNGIDERKEEKDNAKLSANLDLVCNGDLRKKMEIKERIRKASEIIRTDSHNDDDRLATATVNKASLLSMKINKKNSGKKTGGGKTVLDKIKRCVQQHQRNLSGGVVKSCPLNSGKSNLLNDCNTTGGMRAVRSENVVMERMTRKELQGTAIIHHSDSISGTKRVRTIQSQPVDLNQPNSRLSLKSINNSNDKDNQQNSRLSLKSTKSINTNNGNCSSINDERDSGGRLLNVDLGQLLLKRGIDEDQIDQFQQIVSFTSYNPKLPEIFNQIEKPTSNLNESSVSITNEKQKCINNQVENSIINQDQTAKLDQSADSIYSQKDNSLISGNVQSISTQIDEADNREQVSLPKIEDNQYLSQISQYFQSALDCKSDKEIAELARKSVTMESESEAEKFIDSIFDWMSQQVKEQNQPLLSGKKERAVRCIYWLAVFIVQHSYRAYSHYSSRSINFIRENSSSPEWPCILLRLNMTLLVGAKRWDDFIGMFLDFARLPSLSLLFLVAIVDPKYLSHAEVMQSHSKLVEILRRLVLLEHAYQSYSIINSGGKFGERIIDKLKSEFRDFWLGGTQSVIESGDWCSASRRKECLAGILGMIKETIDQYRLKKNPLADRIVNLDKDIETKFSR